MHTLSRRIEELEKAALAIQRDLGEIEKNAMWDLALDQLELLISSIGAERQGRPLNAAESAARQAYSRVVEAECRRNRLSPNGWFKPSFDFDRIKKSILVMVARSFSPAEVHLTGNVEWAQKEGRIPTEAELAILERIDSLQQRLWQLADCSPAGTEGKEVSDGKTRPAIPTRQ